MHRAPLVLAAILAAFLMLAPSASACSRDDLAYFDAFPDASCLFSQSSTEIDALGGLRLTTDGDLTTETWDTDTDFGVPPALENTLATVGAGAASTLQLPTTALPLTPFATGDGAVLSPSVAATPDNDNVDDPSVVKVGSTYVMYYTGTAEDGRAPAIMRATSVDGRVWTRAGAGGTAQTVLTGGASGDFDEHGVFGAELAYDAADTAAPYKMWFSGVGDVFTQIGYATSTDGITWTKHAGPVVEVGLPGSRDAFAAAQPDVIKDGGLYKMWYEGDDSTKKSIHYATSTDGVTWSKGGMVIDADDGGGNTQFGVFAPTVWKSGATYEMLLAGRKLNSGDFQTKLISASSANGIAWTLGSIALNSGSGFDASNLNSPDVLQDPGAGGAAFKLYYSGNSVDDGDPHTRIGLSQTASGSGWQGGKFDGAGTGDSVLDVSAPGSAFDARSVEGLSVTDAGGTPHALTGAYTGVRTDKVPRLGLVTSADGTTFTPLPTTGQASDGSVVADGGNNQFDEDGHRDPSLLYKFQGSGDDWFLYFTGDNDGVLSIGVSSSPESPITLQPAGPWSNPPAGATLAGDGTGFDATGVSHPSAIHDGATFVIYYTAHNGPVTSIGRATDVSPTGTFATRAEIVISPDPCAPDGKRDPVVAKLGATDYRMLYTGLFDTVDGTLERTCYATSTDGVAWTAGGVALNPSLEPFNFDEAGVTPSGLVLDGASPLRVYTTGTDRLGRTRAGEAQTAFPTPGAPVAAVPSGWATFQFGSAATPAQDFRTLTQTSTGTGAELWMSVLQPYGGDHWSNYFPVTAAAGTANLNFDLRVTGVRVQVREAGPAGAPVLDKAELNHAPVRFSAAGNAVTTEITPPSTLGLADWTSVGVNSSLQSYGTGTGSATATVLDATSHTELVPATALTPGTTTISLDAVDAATHPKLEVRFDLTSSHQAATPQVNSLKVDYTAGTATPTPTPTSTPTATPTPPPPPVLTLASDKAKVVFGQTATLSGTVTQSGVAVAGAGVALTSKPGAALAFLPLATPLTSATGAYTQTVKPTKVTSYGAALTGATPPPTVTIAVAHKVTLKATKKGRKVTLKGKIGPKHAKRAVLLKVKVGKKSFKKLATVKTNRRSAFTFTKRLKKGTYVFRAQTAKDADHLAGKSPQRRLKLS